MIEAVLFDMDGILIDSEREYDKAMREAITRYGHMRITKDSHHFWWEFIRIRLFQSVWLLCPRRDL